jgi:putative ABC transport system permease protein
MLADLRFALRQLAKRPGFTATAVLTLGLGIGATTSVFSVVEAVLLRALPYASPERLVLVWQRIAASAGERMRVPAPDVVDYRERAQSFTDFAFMNRVLDVALGSEGNAEHARVGVVTGNLFSVLGVNAELGRVFTAGEGVLPPNAFDDTTFSAPPRMLLLGHRFWSSRFGGDSSVVGRTVQVNNQPMIVVGVLPARFELLTPPHAGITANVDAWMPLRTDLRFFQRDEGEWRDQDSDNTGMVIGRLRAGATLDRARAEMDAVAAGQRAEIPFYREAGMRLDVVPMHADVVGHARLGLLVLFGIVGTVLLVACLNVANLLLTQATGRRREMALRAALGASRRQLARQTFVESGLLAVGGVALGLLLANWGIDLLLVMAPRGIPGLDAVTINGTVLLFAVLISLVAVGIFATTPALKLASSEATESLRGHGSATGGRQQAKLRRGLVVSQVALSLVLLIASGLLLQSFMRLQRVRPGFEPAGVLTFNVSLPSRGDFGPGPRAELMRTALDRIEALPGVQGAGLIGGLPLGDVVWAQPFGLPGQSFDEWGGNEANFRVITSDYFRAMGTRLLAGRAFTSEEDVVEDERVVIVDEALARRVDAGGKAVGSIIGFPLDGRPTWARIVGVVQNVRHEALTGDARPTLYVPYRQEASLTVAIAVRTGGEPLQLVPQITAAFDEVSAGLPIPVYGFRGLARYVEDALAPARFTATAVGVFAGLALALALVGLYGLMSYGVSQRAREIGVRMAVGARPGRVLSEIIGSGLRLVVIGLGIGLGLAAVTMQGISRLLFEVPAFHPVSYLGIAVLLLTIAGLACYVPARRAARIDPMEVLRNG